MTENNEDIIWRAAEFKYFKKGIGWYLTVIGAALALILFAFWQNNFFFAVFIALAAIMVIFLGKKRPKVVEFKITDEGISIEDDINYNYDQIDGFTIRKYQDRLNEIVIKTNKTVNPFIKMPVDSKILPKAEERLSKHIQEKEYKEAMVDTFADIFRF